MKYLIFLTLTSLIFFQSLAQPRDFTSENLNERYSDIRNFIDIKRYDQAYELIKELLLDIKAANTNDYKTLQVLEKIYHDAEFIFSMKKEKDAQYFYAYKNFDILKKKYISEFGPYTSDKNLKSSIQKVEKLTRPLWNAIISRFKYYEEIDSSFKINNVDTAGFVFNQKEKSYNNFEEEKIVKLDVTGRGKDKSTAIINALKTAIDLTSNSFITSNTIVIGDSLINDEITSVSNAYIKNKTVLSCDTLNSNDVSVLLSVELSLNNLSNFIKSQGVETDYNGEIFAYNQKLRILNEKNEIKSLATILEIAKSLFKNSIDSKIKAFDPIASQNSARWEIPVTIEHQFNQNVRAFKSYLYQKLRNLSVKYQEYQSYISLGLKDQLKLLAIGPAPNYFIDSAVLATNHKTFTSPCCVPTKTLFFHKSGKYLFEFPKITADKNTNNPYSEFNKISESERNNINTELIKWCNILNLDASLENIYTFSRISESYDRRSEKDHSPFVYLRTNESVELLNSFLKELFDILFNVQIENGIESKNLQKLISDDYQFDPKRKVDINYFEFYPGLNKNLSEIDSIPDNYLLSRNKKLDFFSKTPFTVPITNNMFNYIYDINNILEIPAAGLDINSKISMLINLNAFQEKSRSFFRLKYIDTYTIDEIGKISKYKIK